MDELSQQNHTHGRFEERSTEHFHFTSHHVLKTQTLQTTAGVLKDDQKKKFLIKSSQDCC